MHVTSGSWAVGSTLGLSPVHTPGDGRLHKAVSVGPRVHIIEELQIFSSGQPVQNLLLDTHRVSRPRRNPGRVLGGVPSMSTKQSPPSFSSLASAGWKDTGSSHELLESGVAGYIAGLLGVALGGIRAGWP